MGVYRAAVVTESGQNIIAQALANEQPLIFTSAKTSRYAYPLGTNIPALTGLQDVVQSVMPFDSKVINGNVAQVSVRFDNDEIDQVYRIETIGLYAKIEGGTETLFSVTQAITPDEMPIHSDVSPSAYIYNIQHTVQNASQITLTVNPTGTATVQDIMDIEQPEFDDSGTVSGIDSFPAFLNKTKSKMNIFQWYRDFKAGMQFVLHAGQIVNNCVSSDADKPLAAAQGKALQDQLTKLYSDLKVSYGSYVPVFSWSDDNSHPIVQDIETKYAIMSKICFVYTRYNITDMVKTDRRQCSLQVSLPEGVKSVTAIVPLISPYFQTSNEYSKLGARVAGDKVLIVDGIGGDYSGNLIKTGYQGFAVFFMRE